VGGEVTRSGMDALIDALLDSADMAVFLERLVKIPCTELSRVAGEAR
jgi:hypothetical protein